MKLPSFLRDLTDVIEMSTISDDLKKKYLDLIESDEVSEESFSLIGEFVVFVNAEIDKREKQIVLNGDSEMLDQLRTNKQALYDWQNALEELAITEAEQLVSKVDEQGFIKAGMTDGGVENKADNSQQNTPIVEKQDDDLPLSANMM